MSEVVADWPVVKPGEGKPLRDAADLREHRDAEATMTRARYADVAAILAGKDEGPLPSIATRTDGAALLYRERVNGLVGDPETGKSWILLAAEAEVLLAGQRVLHLDLDHNGGTAIVRNLRALGVPVETLVDRDRYRLLEPEDRDEYLAAVDDAADWAPDLVGIDSIGELLPLFGAKSVDGDDFTHVNRLAIAPLARHAAVVYIDHLPKGGDSREYGGIGTVAKKRAANGALLRVVATRPFAPGQGGRARVTVIKDRHGKVREISSHEREPHAADFELIALPEDGLGWKLWAPGPVPVAKSDVELLLDLDPPPKSVRDVRDRMKWGGDRSQNALTLYRSRNE